MSVAVHIIEDDLAVRDALCELLNTEDSEVLSYDSPEAFFASSSPQPKDIIVLDIHFPSESGVDMAMRLKRDHPNARIVVISGIRAGLVCTTVL